MAMYVVCVTVWVKPGHEVAFVSATRDNHYATRREPGNVRFDVLGKEDDPTQFFLYEVYRTRDDFGAHQQTAHYLEWKETVAPYMAQARQGIKHHSLLPDDPEF
jgi:(4S)-4-hydroxy-5-phosphonooxypentane-2,3-dione isomerase